MRCKQTGCMTSSVSKRCIGIGSRSEGVADELGAMAEPVANVQHTHDDAFGPHVPAKQIECTDGYRSSSWMVHANGLHDLGRTQAMQRHRQVL